MRAKWMLGAAMLAVCVGVGGCSDSGTNDNAAPEQASTVTEEPESVDASAQATSEEGSYDVTRYSGLPFKTPRDWSVQQHDLAGKAIALLVEACPAIKTYAMDIEAAKFEEIDQSLPINAQAMDLVLPHPWKRVFSVSMTTASEPKSKILKEARADTRNFFAADGGWIDFDLGTGDDPGIFMQTSLFPEAICGAKHPIAVRTQDRSALHGSPPDTIISVPALQFLDAF